jgi:hypothetical protein
VPGDGSIVSPEGATPVVMDSLNCTVVSGATTEYTSSMAPSPVSMRSSSSRLPSAYRSEMSASPLHWNSRMIVSPPNWLCSAPLSIAIWSSSTR